MPQFKFAIPVNFIAALIGVVDFCLCKFVSPLTDAAK